uniref:Hemerythrin n=1 Tax=Magelona berkeleyi TaxID=1490213 RepID=A0A1S6QD07_9ANNE|nr:hemerythrin [Magelona berkeleyi]
MAYAIPEPYGWNESFRMFYASIDDEHKGLFKSVFDVAADPSSAHALSHCYDVMDIHFSHEEAILQRANYTDILYNEHKKAHDNFMNRLGGLKSPVSADAVAYLKNWLVRHIKTIDFKYRGFVNC